MENRGASPRKIVIELNEIYNRNVGLGEFTFQLGRHLTQRASMLKEKYNIELYFIVPSSSAGIFGNRVKYIAVPHVLRRFVRYNPLHADICHISHQFSKMRYMMFARHNLMTVHDINFIYEKSETKLPKYEQYFRQRLRHVDYLTYISSFVREDVDRHFAPNIPNRVIYNGVINLNTDGQNFADLKRFDLPERYLLHVSSLQPKKNPQLLFEMMRHLGEEHLVLVGNWETRFGRELAAKIKDSNLRNITMLDHVTEQEKASLYKHCHGFLFPSLCEGFGLPPIEAMHFGKPVFLSRLTSLPEVGGNAAYYYDDLTPEQMADVTRRGLRDFYSDPDGSAEKARRQAEQFDWDTCVDNYIDYYLDILNIEKQ